MRLKAFTTFLFVSGVVLLFAYPWVVGAAPAPGEVDALRAYSIRLGIYIIALLTLFFSTTVLAFVVARKTREAFRDEAMRNMKSLVEGTLEDHRRRQNPGQDPET